MEWDRIVLRAAMIVAIVGVVWMHSFSHSHHGEGCHRSEPTTLSAAGIDEAATPVLIEPPRSPQAAADAAHACLATLIGVCMALAGLAMRAPRDRTMVRRSRIRVSPALPRCLVALPAGGRMSFMDLSVLRI